MVTRGKTIEVLAYTAGVVDSDGSIGISRKRLDIVDRWHRKNPHYSAAVIITNTDLALLQWIQEQFGGSIKTRKKVADHHKTTYVWIVSEQKALIFCHEILPYLRVKKRQAELVIELKSGMGRSPTGANPWGGHKECPAEELARREVLYLEAKRVNDDRRPQRPSETAPRTGEAMVCANGKPLEAGGTETACPS